MTWRDVFDVYFGWPLGQVWPNLLSAIVGSAPGFVVSHLLLRRHHAKKIDAQTQDIKAHITSTLQGPSPCLCQESTTPGATPTLPPSPPRDTSSPAAT